MRDTRGKIVIVLVAAMLELFLNLAVTMHFDNAETDLQVNMPFVLIYAPGQPLTDQFTAPFFSALENTTFSDNLLPAVK